MSSKKWTSEDVRSCADGEEILDDLTHAVRSHIWISEDAASRRAKKKAQRHDGRCENGEASFFFWKKERVFTVARRMIRRNSLAISLWLNDHHEDAPDSFQIVGRVHKEDGTVGRVYFDEKDRVNVFHFVLTLKKREDGGVRVATIYPCTGSFEITAPEKIAAYEDRALRIAEKARKRNEAEAEAKAETDPDPDPEA